MIDADYFWIHVIAMKTHVFVIVMKTRDDCRAALAMTQ